MPAGDRLDTLGKLVKEGRVLASDLEGVLLRDMVLLLRRLRTDSVLNMDFKVPYGLTRSVHKMGWGRHLPPNRIFYRKCVPIPSFNNKNLICGILPPTKRFRSRTAFVYG